MTESINLSSQTVLEASGHIIKLRQLLAWDLACMRQHAAKSAFPVQITMLDGKNTQVILNTRDLEDLLGSIVASEISWLEGHNIDTDSIIAEYRAAAEKVLGVTNTSSQPTEQNPS